MTIRHRISAQTDTEPGDDWRERAACKDSLTPDDWFPGKGGLTGPNVAAIQTCRRCPALDQCLAFAITEHPIDGIWGGKTWNERAELARDRERTYKSDVHGERGRYQRGCRCDACVAANRAYIRKNDQLRADQRRAYRESRRRQD